MNGRLWTTHEVARLAKLVKQGLTKQAICKQLGRPEASVRSQIARMGLKTRQQRNWDDAQDMAMLEAISNGHCVRRVAFDLDRTERQLRARLAYLDIKLRGEKRIAA
jgi:hypothetical protein